MSTKFLCDAVAATTRLSETASTGLRTAPLAAHVPGSGSAYSTAGNPMFGTDVTIVSRVRDRKQAAPPRGEIH
jgi:hypothetical protein